MEKENIPLVTEEQIAHYRLGAGLAVADADVDHDLIMNTAEQGIRLAMSLYEPERLSDKKRISDLEEQVAALQKIKAVQVPSEGGNGWIKCSDRLPEHNGLNSDNRYFQVWVEQIKMQVVCCWYGKEHGWSMSGVTQWRELFPSPPQVEPSTEQP